MKSVFEELYYAQYSDVVFRNNPHYQNALKRLSQLEDNIRAVSSKEVNRLLDRYQQQEFNLQHTEQVEAFRQGMLFAFKIFFDQ